MQVLVIPVLLGCEVCHAGIVVIEPHAQTRFNMNNQDAKLRSYSKLAFPSLFSTASTSLNSPASSATISSPRNQPREQRWTLPTVNPMVLYLILALAILLESSLLKLGPHIPLPYPKMSNTDVTLQKLVGSNGAAMKKRYPFSPIATSVLVSKDILAR